MIKLSGNDVAFGENTVSQSGQRMITKSGIRPSVLSGKRLTGFHWNGHRFPPPEPSCVLYLPGYPAQGSIIQDFSGQGNDGTIDGATWVRNSKGLWCLYFNGTSSKVSMGAAKFDTLTECTVELWYKPDIDLDAQATHRFLFCFYQGSNDRMQFYYSQSDDAMRFFEYVGGVSKANIIASAGEGESQTWHLAQCDFGTGGAEVWIDGVSIGTDTETECIADVAATTNTYLGTQISASYWSGYIGLPRIYSSKKGLANHLDHWQKERPLLGV